MNPEDILYSRAPGRVDLSGAGTDLSPYRETHGGQTLSAALRFYSYAMLRPRLDQGIVLRRLNDGAEFSWIQSRDLPLEGPLCTLQAMINRLKPDRGFELILSSDLSPHSGLATEVSMAVAALAILEEFAGQLVQPEEIADLYYSVERFDLGRPVMQHDAYACAMGGLSDLKFDGKAVERQRFLIKESVRMTFETNSILVSTGEPMHSGDVPYEEILSASCAEGSGIQEVQHRLKSIAQSTRDALAAGDLYSFATFVDEEWQAYQQLDLPFTTERSRQLIQAGHQAGSRGGKACGLCGGSLYFYCDDLGIRHKTLQALIDEGCTPLPFQLDELGASVWRQPQTDS